MDLFHLVEAATTLLAHSSSGLQHSTSALLHPILVSSVAPYVTVLSGPLVISWKYRTPTKTTSDIGGAMTSRISQYSGLYRPLDCSQRLCHAPNQYPCGFRRRYFSSNCLRRFPSLPYTPFISHYLPSSGQLIMPYLYPQGHQMAHQWA